MGIGLGAVISAIYNKLISEPQRGCRQIYIFLIFGQSKVSFFPVGTLAA